MQFRLVTKRASAIFIVVPSTSRCTYFQTALRQESHASAVLMANITVRVPSDGIVHRHSQSSFSMGAISLGLMVLPMGEPERTSEGQDLLHKRVVFNAPFTGPSQARSSTQEHSRERRMPVVLAVFGMRSAQYLCFQSICWLDLFPNIEKKVHVATGGGHLKSADPHTLWAQRTGA